MKGENWRNIENGIVSGVASGRRKKTRKIEEKQTVVEDDGGNITWQQRVSATLIAERRMNVPLALRKHALLSPLLPLRAMTIIAGVASRRWR
jgi:hypothetical protein